MLVSFVFENPDFYILKKFNLPIKNMAYANIKTTRRLSVSCSKQGMKKKSFDSLLFLVSLLLTWPNRLWLLIDCSYIALMFNCSNVIRDDLEQVMTMPTKSTYLSTKFPLYRNQATELRSKSVDRWAL